MIKPRPQAREKSLGTRLTHGAAVCAFCGGKKTRSERAPTVEGGGVGELF